ncbi:hypothetical protein DPEC_G00270340 [Dallia pectoralis]|uniref:Uncharacterized protein n=1 Tax=Dallia pectoralis TaxID=75939 RepID=A0ACC2FPE2_DALPE|nr:hypothetical protein DPEC_G00270340 [Dallia pectoralis]
MRRAAPWPRATQTAFVEAGHQTHHGTLGTRLRPARATAAEIDAWSERLAETHDTLLLHIPDSVPGSPACSRGSGFHTAGDRLSPGHGLPSVPINKTNLIKTEEGTVTCGKQEVLGVFQACADREARLPTGAVTSFRRVHVRAGPSLKPVEDVQFWLVVNSLAQTFNPI